jgi:peroxiredoxin
MALLNVGDPAPDFTLQTVEGDQVSRDQLRKSGKNTLLVFLRHLGCLPCREHAIQLCQRHDKLVELNTQVVIVSFGTLLATQAWMKEVCASFQVVLDPDQSTYQAYQLEKSAARSRNLNTLWAYVKLIAAGRKLQPQQGDTTQLGGDFIIDSHGIIRLAHPSRDPADRPAVDDLLAFLKSLPR